MNLYQPETRSRGLALLNDILGWDFGTKEQFVQRMKDRENATLEYNRTACAPLQEEVLGGSDILACSSAGRNIEIESCATVTL